MSYSANQYNYATPLSSATALLEEVSAVNDARYFTLFDNILDGSYVPITGDVGLWGNTLSDANGAFSEPYEISVDVSAIVSGIRLTGSEHSYPVDFTIVCYNDTTVVHTLTVTDNDKAARIFYLPSALSITSYKISISRISEAYSVARLYNAYVPEYVSSRDTLSITSLEKGTVESGLILKISYDTLHVRNNEASGISNIIDITTDSAYVELSEGTSYVINEAKGVDELGNKILEEPSHVLNIIDVTKDTLYNTVQDSSDLTNIHTVMKQPSRRVYGKVYITYTDPMLEAGTIIETSSVAYNSDIQQLLDSVTESEHLYFTLYDNDLSGMYLLRGEYGQAGWVSADISDADGFFSEPPFVKITFVARPMLNLGVAFDTSHDNLVKDFTVIFTTSSGEEVTHTFTDNTSAIVDVVDGTEFIDVVSIKVVVNRVSRPFSPAVILDIPISSTVLYKGYQDSSELMSIDMLEELTYEDDIEALGGISANEVTITFDNSSKAFFFGSGSVISRYLRRNRKIVPWLGAEVVPGEIEWHTLGTYWSYKWDVPADGVTASVVGFDTIGLLGLTNYTLHHTQVGKSIGELVKYVLDDAAEQLSFIEYEIDEALYDIIIPYAWFERGSHAAALRRISECYPMHIYCNRQGRICAKPQRLHLDYHYDEWSNSTNVIDKNYTSLYSTLPNIVNVAVNNIGITEAAELVRDDTLFEVNGNKSVILQFNKPYLSNISVEVDCDSSVSYSYEVYSWGINISFVGTGSVRSVRCLGDSVDSVSTATIQRLNEDSIRLDGAQTRNIASDLIQTQEMAEKILDRIFSLSELDKYDTTVNYRGDISLTINDPIILHDGIAPVNTYNIKRHQLSWNGGLTGSADLNT